MRIVLGIVLGIGVAQKQSILTSRLQFFLFHPFCSFFFLHLSLYDKLLSPSNDRLFMLERRAIQGLSAAEATLFQTGQFGLADARGIF